MILQVKSQNGGGVAQFSPRAARRAAGVLALVGLGLVGCARKGGVIEGRPSPSLSATKQAKGDFLPLGAAWLSGNGAERESLDATLRAFRARHPRDDRARVALVYLAWNAIERGDLEEARELGRLAILGPEGSTRDEATVIEAAILRREGDAEGALLRLQPLVGKMIDPSMRELLDEEVVEAAMQASRFYEAVGYMDVWLQQPDEPGRRSRRKMARALDALPVEVAQAIARAPAESGYSAELRRMLTRRLAQKGDADGDDYAVRDPAHVQGRTVGLVLSLGTSEERALSAEVLSGVLDGLGLPRDDGPTLVTTDDGGDVANTEAALAELAARGSAIVIAGIDPDRAAAALRFAERTALPVILLSAVAGESPKPASAFFAAGGEGGADLDAAASLAWQDPAKHPPLARAGSFPLRRGDEGSPLWAWVERHGSAPTYLGALARDAAVLAEGAIVELPTTRATDPDEVAARYAEGARALERVERGLWTSEARGFGKGHRLAREIRILEGQ